MAAPALDVAQPQGVRYPVGGTGPGRATLLLHGEQGLGDVIQFVRYAPLLARRGARIVLYCPPALAGLLRRLPDISEVVPGNRPCHARRLGLLARGRSRRARRGPRHDLRSLSLPAPSPAAPAAAAAETPLSHRHRLGGKPREQLRPAALLPASRTSPRCSSLPDTEWLSFQVGPRADDLRRTGWRALIREAGKAVTPFDATADALAEVDLVITVDTALAHLAGALGRPVWTLLPFAPDWRWMLGRVDTPWYPTMRLFRQPAPNDWGGVFREVRRALASRLAKARADGSARGPADQSAASAEEMLTGLPLVEPQLPIPSKESRHDQDAIVTASERRNGRARSAAPCSLAYDNPVKSSLLKSSERPVSIVTVPPSWSARLSVKTVAGVEVAADAGAVDDRIQLLGVQASRSLTSILSSPTLKSAMLVVRPLVASPASMTMSGAVAEGNGAAALAGGDRVGALSGRERVVAVTTHEHVVAVTARKDVVAVATVQGVVALAAVEGGRRRRRPSACWRHRTRSPCSRRCPR